VERPINLTGFLSNLSRLWPGHECIGAIDIRDVEQEKHLVGVVHALPEIYQFKSVPMLGADQLPGIRATWQNLPLCFELTVACLTSGYPV
jgi:hypothetical protein